jgi:hypothetical protein
VLASRPRRHGKEPVPRQTKTWKPRRPAFPVPPRTAFSRSAAAPPQREAQGRYLFGTPCIAAAGMSSYVLAQYLVPNHASPGICPGSISLPSRRGACDCPSHLMKAHLPSRRALELIATLRPLPNSRFELHPAIPDAFLAQQHNGLSLTCRFCSSYLYRRLSPQPGAQPQPQLKKKQNCWQHTNQPLHSTSTRRGEPK